MAPVSACLPPETNAAPPIQGLTETGSRFASARPPLPGSNLPGDIFAHALLPGHHMQSYMTQRYRAYRSIFSTAFWTEGGAFYWEMLMWDLGFTHTPEQRVGALFWRDRKSVV